MSKEIKIELVYTRFAAIGERMIADVDRVVHRTAQAVLRDAVVAIESPPKTGRTYASSPIKHRLTKSDYVFDVTMFGQTRQYTQHGLLVTESRGGNLYKTVGYIYHRASAPGEAPATDTGALANNTGIEVLGFGERDVVFYSEYAKPLEFGTPTILPRPFLRPAVERHREEFIRALDTLVRTGRAGDDVAAGGGGGGA